TDILRNEFGFNGVIITDAMDMGAIAKFYTSADAAVKIVQAGVDMLLMPDTLSEAVSGIETAVNNGEISEQRINESVRRILDMKEKYGII
ncbi:MAG: glycoside hydrolase family 3 N-terminal domain-containing protein, partial [Oscillospiraceae bacterium]